MAAEPMMKFLNVRYRPDQHQRWTQAADRLGLTVSELAHQLLNEKATEVLDCPHRITREFPWATLCLECGVRL